MLIKKQKILYLMYWLIVAASFVQSVDIFPFSIKFIFNKVFYLSLILFIAISISATKIEITKNTQAAVKWLSAYSFFYFVSNFYHREEGWFASSLGNGIFYLAAFFVIHIASRSFPFKKIISPFLVIIGGLMVLSLAMLAGLPLQYYNIDPDLIESYLVAKSSLELVGFSGVYLNQNAFVVLAFLGASAYLLSYQYDDKYHKNNSTYLNVAMILLSLTCAVMTMSRAGLLACAILFFLYFLKKLGRKGGFYLAFGIVCFSFFIAYFLDGYMSHFIFRVENDGTSNRLEIWGDALNVFMENSVFGAGEYKYYTAAGHLTSHNIYLQLLASQGIITFLCWFGFIFSFLKTAVKNIVKIKIDNQPIAVISSICLIAILVHQFFETMIIGAGVPLVLFMFILLNAIKGVGQNRSNNKMTGCNSVV